MSGHRGLRIAFLLALISPQTAPGAEEALTAKQFAELQQLIKPDHKERRWETVPWQTNMDVARKLAVAEDKPLLVWSGVEVLGRA